MNKMFVVDDCFFDTLEEMPIEISEECIHAMCMYALDGEVPENMSPAAKMGFMLLKPLIDANNKRHAGMAKGGRPRKNLEEGR